MVEVLRQNQQEFPQFAAHLEETIHRIESEGKRSRSQIPKTDRLADLLRAQKKHFRGHAILLNDLIARVEASAQRTRKSDREKVIETLRAWGGLSIREIMEDTGFSHWDVRQILKELIAAGAVARKPEPGFKSSPATWQFLYELKH